MARLVDAMKCQHEESREPGKTGVCYKCREEITGAGWVRNPADDYDLLCRVSQDRDLVDMIYRQVTERAGTDEQWHSVAHRDFVREVREELLDGCAYLMGQADQRKIRGYVDPLSSGQLMALHHLVEAYRCLHTPDDD